MRTRECEAEEREGEGGDGVGKREKGGGTGRNLIHGRGKDVGVGSTRIYDSISPPEGKEEKGL